MSVQVYQKENYKIYKVKNGFIVHNSIYKLSDKHTHIKSFKQAKDIISFVISEKIPKRVSFYYLQSLIRFSDNEKYINGIKKILSVRKRKTKVKFVRQNYKISI